MSSHRGERRERGELDPLPQQSARRWRAPGRRWTGWPTRVRNALDRDNLGWVDAACQGQETA